MFAWLEPYKLIAELVVIAVLLGIIGVEYAQVQRADAKWQAEVASHDKDKADAATASLAASERARLAEQKLTQTFQGEINEATQQTAKASVDRDAAAVAAGRLSKRVDAYIAAARARSAAPAASGASAPASDPTGMLADVLGRCSARVRLLATFGDASTQAGRVCEFSYDEAVKTTNNGGGP